MRLAFTAKLLIATLLAGTLPTLALSQSYTLGSGDMLRITTFGEEDLSGEFEVSSSGSISFPLIGSVPAKGLSLDQLEVRIESMLMDGYLKSPNVSIEVLNYRPFYILGEVKEPGSYAYVSGMTILNAIALGGGFTYRAEEEEFTVIRGNDPAKKSRKVGPEAAVLPGDVITVDERFF